MNKLKTNSTMIKGIFVIKKDKLRCISTIAHKPCTWLSTNHVTLLFAANYKKRALSFQQRTLPHSAIIDDMSQEIRHQLLKAYVTKLAMG